jgi:DNA processing protein
LPAQAGNRRSRRTVTRRRLKGRTSVTESFEQLRAWAILVRAPGCNFERLRAALGSIDPERLVVARTRELEQLDFPENARRYLAAAGSAGSAEAAALEADIAWLTSSPDHHLVPLTSPAYPPLLAQTGGAPVALYVRGTPGVLQLAQLAIVGSRNPTASGRETAFEFARHLAGCGLAITSGMAEGIDAAAHRGALAGGATTIAVCGTGLGEMYPAQHAALAAEIAAHGALVSEFPPDAPARREHFPQRNRIISGLSLGTLVVEAARQSGSLITARHASEQGREVFAIPGSIHSPLSRGCHRLIRDGARLVETADDVLAELGMVLQASGREALRAPAPHAPLASRTPRDDGAALDKEYEILLDALGFDPTGIDALVERSGLKPESVASMLLILELRGTVEARPGGRYCRRANQAQK